MLWIIILRRRIRSQLITLQMINVCAHIPLYFQVLKCEYAVRGEIVSVAQVIQQMVLTKNQITYAC